MDDLKWFASDHPIRFGLVTTLLLWVLYIVAAVLAAIVSRGAPGHQLVEAVGRAAASLLFLFVLWRFRWLSAAGVTRLGGWQAWLLALPVLVYEIVTHFYAMFGDLAFVVSDPAVAGFSALDGIAAGLMEEIAFRGVVLYGLVRVWGDSARGITRSVLASALIFGAAHLIHIGLGSPAPQTILLALSTFLAGIYYAAFVLHGRSIWPAVVLHALLNGIVNLKAVGIAGFEETVSAWLLIVLFQLPVVLVGAYLLRSVSPRRVVPEAA